MANAKQMPTRFYLAARNSRGNLAAAAKRDLQKRGVKLLLTRGQSRDATAVVRALKKAVADVVELPDPGSFVILVAPVRVPPGSLAAECKCMCSLTSDCGGGGGGGGKRVTDLLAALTNPIR